MHSYIHIEKLTVEFLQSWYIMKHHWFSACDNAPFDTFTSFGLHISKYCVDGHLLVTVEVGIA
jgi:hypothetical protein